MIANGHDDPVDVVVGDIVVYWQTDPSQLQLLTDRQRLRGGGCHQFWLKVHRVEKAARLDGICFQRLN